MHPYQVLTYILTTLNLAVVPLVLSPLLESLSVILLACLFFPCQVTVAVLGFKITRSDPTDPAVYIQHEIDHTKYPLKCETCDVNVALTTKHCGQCNRCCIGFDHHCKWINNCVGQINYALFLAVTVAQLLTSLILLAFAAEAGAGVLADYGGMEERVDRFYGAEVDMKPLVVFLVLGLSENVMVVGACSVLLVFHAYLRFNRLTTYQYLKLRNRVKVASELALQPESKQAEAADITPPANELSETSIVSPVNLNCQRTQEPTASELPVIKEIVTKREL